MFDDRIGNLQKMLARMGPEGRQKYATDHADDPIAVSMALFVNNIAKEIKEGKRGEPDMPPPVVQQAIQSMTQPKMPPQGPPQQGPQQGPPQGMPPQGMPPQGPPQGIPPPQGQPQMAADGGYMDSRLPEEMGIGALPERSLSNMADGGIVGYAETGLVSERWQDMKKLPNESGEDFARRVALARQASYQAQMFPTDEQKEAARKQALEKERAKNMAEVNTVDSMSLPPRPLGPYGAPTVPRQEGVLPNQAGSGGAEDPNGVSAPRPAPRPAALPSAAPPAGARAGTAPAQQQEDYGALFNRIRSGLPDARVSMPKEFKEMGDLREDQANKEIASEQDAKAGLASLLGKRETRIGEREKRLADKSSNDINMALIDAGLSMMQSVKPGFAGIAEGLTTGAKRYAEESRLTETARQKIEDARDAHDDLKFNREDMSRKQILAAQGKLVDAKVAVKKDVVDYLAREKDISTKVAGHVFDAKVAQILEGQKQKFQTGENVLNRANILTAAGISSGAGLKNQLGLLEALGGAAPDSAVAKGFKMQKQEAQEPMLFKVYTDAQKDPLNGDKFKTQYPDFASFLADFNKRSGFSALPGGAATPNAPVVLPR